MGGEVTRRWKDCKGVRRVGEAEIDVVNVARALNGKGFNVPEML